MAIEKNKIIPVRFSEAEYRQVLKLAGIHSRTKNGKANVSGYLRKCSLNRPEIFLNKDKKIDSLRLEVRKLYAKLHRVIAFDEANNLDIEEFRNIEKSLLEVVEMLKGED